MLVVHEDLRVSSCGFYVCVKYPYLGVPPDAVVESKCCGKGVVEMKRLLYAREDLLLKVAEENQSFCLQECDNGKLQFNHNYSYYYQCRQIICFAILLFGQKHNCILSAWLWVMLFYTNPFLLQRTSSVTVVGQNFLESGTHKLPQQAQMNRNYGPFTLSMPGSHNREVLHHWNACLLYSYGLSHEHYKYLMFLCNLHHCLLLFSFALLLPIVHPHL